jgi:hypothetical protein
MVFTPSLPDPSDQPLKHTLPPRSVAMSQLKMGRKMPGTFTFLAQFLLFLSKMLSPY